MPKKSRLGKITLQKDIFDTALKDNLKSTVDITALFNHFGVKLTQKGKSFVGLCPWHDDKTPSLSVDKTKGLYNCFGCGESGDIFTLTEKMKGIEFPEALEYVKAFQTKSVPILSATPLAESLKTANKPVVVNENSKPEPKEKADVKETKKQAASPNDTMTLNLVAEYYHKRLLSCQKAIEYLSGRGITGDCITRFKLGFADGKIVETVGEEGFKTLQRLGILTEKGNEFFRNCVVVPLTDSNGQTLSFYGRSINPTSKMNHLYMPGEHKALFNEKAYKVYDQIILTESVIDALSLFSVGIQNVSCIYGTNGLTDSHITAMYEHLVPEVVLALDNDEAGRKAALNHRDQLVDEDRRVKIIFPEGKDWNEDLVSGKLSKESILAQIEKVEEQKPEPSGRVFRQTDTGIVLEYNNVRYEIQAEGIRFRINCWYEGKLFVDMVNLYSAKSRQTFINTLTEELCLERASIKNDIQELVKYLLTESKVDKKEGKSDEIELTESEKQAGLELLQDPQIFERIVKDMDVLGYVGEELNKVLVYIVSRSCQLASPFSVIVTSQSASGKSALVETVEDLTPKERLMAVSSFTDQALNYAKNINRKFLTISEMMHKEEIEYQLRDIQSKHKLSRMLTMKDLKTGMMESKQIETEAYISIAMTTTSTEINQENASRCFIIQVDESVEQTARILREQKKKFKLEGLEDTEDRQPAVIQAHHAAARMLRPVSILIPYVDAIHYPARFMRVRRDHIRFLYLIAAVCHIRQYQKDMKNHKGMNYIEADAYDYRVAYQQLTENKILSNVSELPRGARDLYEYMREYAREKAESSRLAVNEVTMTQRNLREYTGFGQMWVKRHIRILVDYEYVLCIRGGSARAKGYYKLLADEPIEKIDTDGITTPKEIEAIICKKFE